MINFKNFLREAISGTELVGPVGPAYGETGIQNKTLDRSDTTVILSDIDNKFYTYDEYNNIYNDYLKKGGTPLDGFNRENINKILQWH